jgi:hypothetical protein
MEKKLKYIQLFEADVDAGTDQIAILTTKLNEYNTNKSKLVSFLDQTNEQQLFDNLLASLTYKDNDLLRYEWAFQKSNRDVKKYKDLIDKTIVEYNSKKI